MGVLGWLAGGLGIGDWELRIEDWGLGERVRERGGRSYFHYSQFFLEGRRGRDGKGGDFEGEEERKKGKV